MGTRGGNKIQGENESFSAYPSVFQCIVFFVFFTPSRQRKAEVVNQPRYSQCITVASRRGEAQGGGEERGFSSRMSCLTENITVLQFIVHWRIRKGEGGADK